jgi:hypothetical protein
MIARHEKTARWHDGMRGKDTVGSMGIRHGARQVTGEHPMHHPNLSAMRATRPC